MIGNAFWTWRKLFRPELGLLVALTVLEAVYNVLPAVQPTLSRWIVNDLVGGRTTAVLLPGVMMSLTFLLPDPLERLGQLPRSALEDRTVRRVDELVIDVGESMPDSGSVERPAIHNKIKHAQNDLLMLARVPHLSISVVAQALGVITLLGSLASLAWWLPLVLLAAGIPHMRGEHKMIMVRYTRMKEQARIARELDYCMTAATEPQLAKEIRAFDLGEFFLQRFDALSRRTLAEMLRLRLRSSRSAALGALGYGLAVAACFAYIAWQAAENRLTAGDISLYLTAVTSLFMGLFGLGNVASMVANSLRQVDALRELETEAGPGIIISEPGAPAPARFSHGITISAVTFGYPGTDEADDHEPDLVLQGVDLQIPAGKVLALVGENGEGKSTLVKLLTRMYDPTSGAITIDGVPIEQYDLGSLRQRIATVYQDHARFALTAEQNMAIGAPETLTPQFPAEERRRRVEDAAARGGADTVVAGLANGYDTELTRKFGGVDLSGGEWQRVATARAFLPDAALIILDEPTSALDVDAERRLFDSFAELVQGRTAIMISHRFSTVRTADVIAVLADGRIAEYGSHHELMALNGHYAELFNLQADRYRD